MLTAKDRSRHGCLGRIAKKPNNFHFPPWSRSKKNFNKNVKSEWFTLKLPFFPRSDFCLKTICFGGLSRKYAIWFVDWLIFLESYSDCFRLRKTKKEVIVCWHILRESFDFTGRVDARAIGRELQVRLWWCQITKEIKKITQNQFLLFCIAQRFTCTSGNIIWISRFSWTRWSNGEVITTTFRCTLIGSDDLRCLTMWGMNTITLHILFGLLLKKKRQNLPTLRENWVLCTANCCEQPVHHTTNLSQLHFQFAQQLNLDQFGLILIATTEHFRIKQ